MQTSSICEERRRSGCTFRFYIRSFSAEMRNSRIKKSSASDTRKVLNRSEGQNERTPFSLFREYYLYLWYCLSIVSRRFPTSSGQALLGPHL
jgi:hypothetical protein